MPGTLSDLLQELGVQAGTVVAEVGGVIIRREEFGRTPLADGQSIELVRFMGGG
jgi:sulfur carrier protein